VAYDARVDLYEFMQESNARARRGRRLARAMFAVGLIPLGLAAFFFIAAPNFTSATFAGPGPIGLIVPAIGVLGTVIGLVWMVRILRADPEPDARSWRYRE
jgi:Flp pilus assembly protein TadB